MTAAPRPARLIACEVFRPFIENQRVRERFPGVEITYVPANLHTEPGALKARLEKEFRDSRQRDEDVICMYGECFPDIDLCCSGYAVLRIDGHHCYEILLGREQFNNIMKENARTYFLEQGLVMNFGEYCVRPLELDDAEMRQLLFGHYDRLVYISQPSDPDLGAEVRAISEYLGLTVSVRASDYDHIETCLTERLKSIHDKGNDGEEKR